MKARRDAMAADVVVVNHHLFFADMALRDSGVAELLPSVEVAVFDEAHQLAEAGVQFLGTTLGTGQVIDFARDLLAAGLQQARGLAPWQELAAACDRAARDLRMAAAGPLRELRGSAQAALGRARRPSATSTPRCDAIGAACDAARRGTRDGGRDCRPTSSSSAERARLARRPGRAVRRRAGAGQRALDRPVAAPGAAGRIAARHPRRAARADGRRRRKAWIFTSATLGDDDAAELVHRIGRARGRDLLRVGSPFDYAAHARLYVPRAVPEAERARAPRRGGRAGGALRRGARRAHLRADDHAARAADDRRAAARRCSKRRATAIEVLVQGRRRSGSCCSSFLEREPRSVLVGSQSFWEGIDVPGDALQCVLIDKLPFPPPNDPLVEARVKRLEAAGPQCRSPTTSSPRRRSR